MSEISEKREMGKMREIHEMRQIRKMRQIREISQMSQMSKMRRNYRTYGKLDIRHKNSAGLEKGTVMAARAFAGVRKHISLLVALLSVLIAAFSIKETAYCMEKSDAKLDNNGYIKELENEYLIEIESTLNDCGCPNAGVMLTKVMYEDGYNEYTLSVNHKKLKKEGAAKNEIISKLNEVDFPVVNSSLLIVTLD